MKWKCARDRCTRSCNFNDFRSGNGEWPDEGREGQEVWGVSRNDENCIRRIASNQSHTHTHPHQVNARWINFSCFNADWLKSMLQLNRMNMDIASSIKGHTHAIFSSQWIMQQYVCAIFSNDSSQLSINQSMRDVFTRNAQEKQSTQVRRRILRKILIQGFGAMSIVCNSDECHASHVRQVVTYCWKWLDVSPSYRYKNRKWLLYGVHSHSQSAQCILHSDISSYWICPLIVLLGSICWQCVYPDERIRDDMAHTPRHSDNNGTFWLIRTEQWGRMMDECEVINQSEGPDDKRCVDAQYVVQTRAKS